MLQISQVLNIVMSGCARFDAKVDEISADTNKAIKLLVPPSAIKWHELEAVVERIRELQLRYYMHIVESEASVPMSEARQLFDDLDADKSGFLQGEEVEAFANWVYAQATPGGASLPEHHLKKLAADMLNDVDEDGDAQISFDEFSKYFSAKAAQLDHCKQLMELISLEKKKPARTEKRAHVFASLQDVPEIDDVALKMVLKKFTDTDTKQTMLLHGDQLQSIMALFFQVLAREGADWLQ